MLIFSQKTAEHFQIPNKLKLMKFRKMLNFIKTIEFPV